MMMIGSVIPAAEVMNEINGKTTNSRNANSPSFLLFFHLLGLYACIEIVEKNLF